MREAPGGNIQLAPRFPKGPRFKSYTGVHMIGETSKRESRNSSIRRSIKEDKLKGHSLSPKRGITFGMGRDSYQRVFSETRPYIPDGSMPGPGSYKVETFV